MLWLEFLLICMVVVAVLEIAPVSAQVAAQVTVTAESPSSAQVSNAIVDLASKEPQTRRDASQLLKENFNAIDQASIERIAVLLQKEKDAQVRLNIFDMAIALRGRAEPLIPALLDSLRKDFGSRRNEELHQDFRAALALSSIGAPSVPGLKEMLSFSKANVRSEAAMALGRIGPASDDATSELIRLLGDENERVRQEAANALAAIGEPAIPTLVDIAKNGSEVQKVSAIRALGSKPIADATAKSIIDDALECSDLAVRAAAIVASMNTALSEERIHSMARENLGHKDELIRRSMINRLQGVNTLVRLRLKPALIELLTHSDANVASDAAFLLQSMGPDVASEMIDAFANAGSHIDSLAAAIAMMGPRISKRLLAGMQDPRDRVREGCAVALGQVRPLPVEGINELSQGLSDRVEGVQVACLNALGSLGQRAKSTIPMIEAKMRSSNPVLRAKSAKAFFQVSERNEATVRQLAPLVDDSSEEVQLNTIQVLLATGPLGRLAMPNVLKHLESSSREIQSAVLAFIASHGRAAEEAAIPLERLLGMSTEKDLQLQIVNALSQLGKAAAPAKEQLTAILQSDGDAPLRVASLETLSNLELPFAEIRPLLSKALTDSQEEVRRRALRAIRKYGPESRVFLTELISLIREDEKADSTTLREIQRIEKHGLDSTLVPRLVELLSSNNPKQLRVVVKFLGLATREDALGALAKLEELTKHSNESVRESALESLNKLRASSNTQEPPKP